MTWLFHPLALRLSRGALAVVMLLAAVSKLADPPGFAQAIYAYDLVPIALVAPLALTLPWLETLTALGLVLGVARRSAALLILVMMLAFLGGLGFNLARGNPVDCGCFGASKVQKTKDQRLLDMKMAMLRDLGFALLALHALLAPGQKPE